MVIAVIGSARIEEEDIRWQQAFELGRSLALNSFVVMTGGYGGLMAATARGAVAGGGSTIGLPMTNWGHLTPDSSHMELRWSEDYFQRLSHLLASDYIVVLDGGIGTLSEMALAWAIGQTENKRSQVLVMGTGIKELVEKFRSSLVISENDMNLVKFLQSPEEIVTYIRGSHGEGEKPGVARG